MRIAGWEQALVATIEKHGDQPFGWGRSDCAILAADAIAAVTGDDVLGPHRGYQTELGAAKALLKGGCADVGELFALHFEEIPPSLARRGDVGVILRDGQFSGGVFTSQGFVSKAEQGLIHEPVTAVARAFRVG